MMTAITTISEMTLDGGIACLDFINSGLDTEKNTVTERIHDYHDVIILAERLSILDQTRLSSLQAAAKAQPEQAEAAMATVRKVRLVLTKVFTALATGEPETINQKVLAAFNNYILSALSQREFIIKSGHLSPDWKENKNDLLLPVWFFVLSAYELLRNSNQHYIKQCGGCQWLFLDESKNHKRKWCDMQSCGSVEKSKRYYLKKKAVQ